MNNIVTSSMTSADAAYRSGEPGMRKTQPSPGAGKMLPQDGNVSKNEVVGTRLEQPSRTPSEDELNAAVNSMRDYAQNTQSELSFSIDKDTGRTVIKVLDKKSQEVIRQIPAEEVMALARHLAVANDHGNLLNASA